MAHKLLLLPAVFVAASMMSGVAAAQVTSNQTAAASSSSAANAKPSPYQGVSTPPTDDIIVTTDVQPAAQPAAPPPAVSPVTTPHATVAAAPPVPEGMEDDDDEAYDDTAAKPHLSREPSYRTQISGADLDGQVVTYVPGPANALPEGTVFRVSMLQNVLAGDVTPGTVFRAKLEQNLMYNGHVAVPVGSELLGRIIYATHGRRITGTSVIHLRADEFILPDGTHYHLHAQVIDTKGSDTKATGEGNIAEKFHGKRTILEFAVASGGGALVGAKFGGPAGAAIGSAVGAGVIGAHMLLANQAVDLPEQSTVIFSLTDPMFLNPSRN